MSVQIPTAEGRPPEPPAPASRPPAWVIGTILTLVAVTAIAITTTREDEEP